MSSCSFYLVDVDDITGEYFDPSDCSIDFIHTDAYRSTVTLQDHNHSTCLQPFEFANHLYVAKVPVHHRYKRQQRIVQISGWNITCHPLHDLQVHVTRSGSEDRVVLCQVLLPTKQAGDGLVLCSYKCSCDNGCSYMLVSVFHSRKSETEPASLQLCEVEV